MTVVSNVLRYDRHCPYVFHVRSSLTRRPDIGDGMRKEAAAAICGERLLLER